MQYLYFFSFFRKVENQVGTYCPNGYMIVFAVDDEDSLDEAEKTLSYLKKEEILQHQAVILVANKTDLVRSRLISTSSKFPLYLIHIYTSVQPPQVKIIPRPMNIWMIKICKRNLAENYEVSRNASKGLQEVRSGPSPSTSWGNLHLDFLTWA